MLEVDQNMIDSIPEVLANLPKLTSLYARDNFIELVPAVFTGTQINVVIR
jgi:Leucine-rich repeat (LRR) protein